MKDKLIRVRDVAVTLDCSPKTVLRYIREGHLPGVRVGKRWYYVLESALHDFIHKGGNVVLRERLARVKDDGGSPL